MGREMARKIGGNVLEEATEHGTAPQTAALWREDGSSLLESFADALWISLWAKWKPQPISAGLVSAEAEKEALAASVLTQSQLIEGARAQS